MCAWNFYTASLHRHAIRLWCHHEIPSSIWTGFMLVKFCIYSLLECKTTCELFDFQLFFSRLFGFVQLKEAHTSRSVLCQGSPRGGSEEWSISPNLISCNPPSPHPLVTMPLCAAPTSLVPSLLQPTCEMLFCCLVPPQLEHLPLDPSTPLLFLHST